MSLPLYHLLHHIFNYILPFEGGTPDILSTARQVLTDWNHQKIPYFSVHPSSAPSVVPNTGAVVIAPGAETVGQAQILKELSKPFELAGLFGAADAGAFGGADEEMADGQDGAQEEPDLMDEDGWVSIFSLLAVRLISFFRIQMDLTPRITRKRSHSPTPSIATNITSKPKAEATTRAPKRQRRTKDVPAYDAPIDAVSISRSNSMGRKVLKKEAKKAQRDATR